MELKNRIKYKLIKSYNYIFSLNQFVKINLYTLVFDKFIHNFKQFKNTNNQKNNGIILVQIIEDFEYALRMGAASKYFSEKYLLQVKLFDCYWDVRLNKFNFQKYLNLFNIKTGIQKSYLFFGDDIIYSNSNKYYNQNFIHIQTEIIYSKIKNTSDILNIQIENIVIGDLIYDTYLRYYHKPTIKDIDVRLKYLINISLDIYYTFTDILNKNNIKILLQSYTSYITHGITARICINKNIKVYCISSGVFIIQEITKDYPYHGINHTKFSQNKLISKEKLSLAREQLEFRFKGGIDNATSYMKNSTYFISENNKTLKNLFKIHAKNIVIYAHDFYDSPHINRCLQFDDLYKFLEETLFFLNTLHNTSIFIKIHPNGLSGADNITKQLVQSFNNTNFHILDTTISNLDIINLKPNLIATARGTIGIEMAYFGIPVVALYDNLYINFNFVHSCYTKEEYYKVLSGELSYNINFDKENIHNFYYQTYLEKYEFDKKQVLNAIRINNTDSYSIDYIRKFKKKNNDIDLVIKDLILLYKESISNHEIS